MSYMCTKGQAPVFVNNDGVNSPGPGLLALKHTSLADTMQYTLVLTNTGSGTGFGAGAQTLTLTGTIVQAQFQNAAAGPYSDTVTITWRATPGTGTNAGTYGADLVLTAVGNP